MPKDIQKELHCDYQGCGYVAKSPKGLQVHKYSHNRKPGMVLMEVSSPDPSPDDLLKADLKIANFQISALMDEKKKLVEQLEDFKAEISFLEDRNTRLWEILRLTLSLSSIERNR